MRGIFLMEAGSDTIINVMNLHHDMTDDCLGTFIALYGSTYIPSSPQISMHDPLHCTCQTVSLSLMYLQQKMFCNLVVTKLK